MWVIGLVMPVSAVLAILAIVESLRTRRDLIALPELGLPAGRRSRRRRQRPNAERIAMSIALLLLFLLLSALGVPLAVALGLASRGDPAAFTSTPIDLLSQSMFSAMNSFLLVAVPLFILVGVLMERGRVAEKLFDFAEAMRRLAAGRPRPRERRVVGDLRRRVRLVGRRHRLGRCDRDQGDGAAWLSEGLRRRHDAVHVDAVVDHPALDPDRHRRLNRQRVDRNAAGRRPDPGLFIAFAFMVFNHFYSVHYGYNPPSPLQSAHVVVTGLRAILPMLTPVILLVGIVDGYFTPTEAAAIAVLYTLFLAVMLYRTIRLSETAGHLRRDGAHLRHDPVHRRHREARRLGLHVRRPAVNRWLGSSARSAPARRWCSS